MKLSELLQGVPVLDTNTDPDQQITGVSYDSRLTRPGDLFVAIAGLAADGHTFIPAAQEKGAKVILCQTPPQTGAYVQVASTRAALAILACNWFGHPAGRMKLVGVTGTNGKTTTTYLLKSVLEQALNAKVGLIGTIQNMIGDQVLHTERTTPESWELQALFAQMADAGCTHVIMEVSSHALALNRVDGFRFHTGVFTNLTQDHLDFHKTMQAYLEAKASLFTRCDYGVVNLDDPASARLLELAQCPMLTFGEHSAADLTANEIELGSDHVAMRVHYQQESLPLYVGIPGDFTVHNALGVVGAALTLGLSLKQITAALASAKGVKGRVEVVPTPGKDYTILIDYAHTPDALENVLRTVRESARGRVVALFGCGGDRDRTKRPIMGQIAARIADFCVVTSDNPRTEEPNAIIKDILAGMQDTTTPYTVIPDRRAAIRWAMDNAQPGDVIVLAGKGHEDYQILGTTKVHLDEREVVQAHLDRTDLPETEAEL